MSATNTQSLRTVTAAFQSGDYFIAVCSDGTVWQMMIAETESVGSMGEWEKIGRAIPQPSNKEVAA